MNPNQQQLDIIHHIDGPCLVTAVPGSGKTTSITERTRNLVSLGISPSSLLAITFTNKAADEMRSRIASKVGKSVSSKMTISTFHSLCARILQENAFLIGLRPGYTIYNDDDQQKLLKSCIHKVVGDAFKIPDQYIKSIFYYIEEIRNSCTPIEEAKSSYKIDGKQSSVVDLYFSTMRINNAIDFSGLLSETNRLFEENLNIRDKYRAKWIYISVDEVQDTNIAQYRFINYLAGGHKNILCVGDVDQSVYRWRGASPENLFRFERDFGAKVLKLETNYRSTPEILKYSQALIEKNSLRKATILRTDNASGDQPKAIMASDESEMANELGREALRHIRSGVRPNEICILYRTNYVSRIIEMVLRGLSVRYKVIGGLSFWDRKEVKQTVRILKFLANPDDRLAFESLVESCCKGVGPKGVASILDRSTSENKPIMETCQSIVSENCGLAKHINPLIKVVASGQPPHAILRQLVAGTAFGERLAKDSTTEHDRRENVEEVARDLETQLAGGQSLSGYLQLLSLASTSDEDSEEGEVKLMTMHACKGLEFDIVLISHVCDGIVPHRRVLELQDDKERSAQLEEERRLMYVAMTRARKVLRVYSCAKRGKDRTRMSRFVGESTLPAFKIMRNH